jgi:ribose 1,5-bisphosphokinase PhnN
MDTMTESERAQERAREVKLILRRLIAEVEAAEVDAADTTWPEEKTSLIESALNDVQWRCSNLAYDIGYAGGTLLTKREAE